MAWDFNDLGGYHGFFPQRFLCPESGDKLFVQSQHAGKSVGRFKLNIKKRKGQKKRKASLDVYFSKVEITNPIKRKETIKCNVVYVIEKKPPKEQEPLKWFLLTSLDVISFKEANYRVV